MADNVSLVAKTTISKPDRRYWSGDVEYGKRLSGMYSIGIMSIPLFEYITFPGINPANKKSGGGLSLSAGPGDQALYKFTTPPQSYEISEAAATTIIPTQGGGKFIESHGNIFKDIRIAGTVGFRPSVPSKELFPGLQAAGGPMISNPTTFLPDFLTKDNRGLDPTEITGFDEMMFLRNIFRAYYDLKANDAIAGSLAMVWLYAKESEGYVVEPISFTTSRDRSNPLGWNYAIQLRTLYKLDVTFPFVKDSVNLFQAISNAFGMLRSITNGIARALTEIANLIDYFANLPASIIHDMLQGFTTVLSAVAAVRNAGASFADTVSESVVAALEVNGRNIQGLYDEINGESSNPARLFEGDVGRARHAITSLARFSKLILAMDGLWQEDKQIQVSDYSRAYLTETGEAPVTAGSQLNPANIALPASAKEVEVIGGNDIRTLAKKHLGDEAEWKKLAILNNLKPPYISEEGGDGVLQPGDKILVPQRARGDEGALTVARTINSDASAAGQQPIMKRYGRDLRLLESDGGELTDFAVSSSGDIDMVEGPDNVIQAIKIKFSTEQGELPTHPTFGAKYPVGVKVTLNTIQEFAINTRRTFFQDPRVEDVVAMDIYALGDSIVTKSKVTLRDSEIQLPFTFSVRR